MTKLCLACHTRLEVVAFRSTPDTLDGYKPICAACESLAHRTGQTYCLSCQRVLPLIHFGPARSVSHICTMCLHSARSHGQTICLNCFVPQDRTHFWAKGTPVCTDCRVRLRARTMKCCRHCRRVKPITDFAAVSGSRDGHRHTCRTCIGALAAPAAPQPTLLEPEASPATTVGAIEHHDWSRWARMLITASDWIILDLETTGVGADAQITEIAAITMSGEVVINTLVRPDRPIPYFIAAKTGITDALVRDAPTFATVYEQFRAVFTFYRIVAYNAPFDIRILQQNIRRTVYSLWEPRGYLCLMRLASTYIAQQEGSTPSLTLGAACRRFHVTPAQAHRALGDCQSSLALLQALAHAPADSPDQDMAL